MNRVQGPIIPIEKKAFHQVLHREMFERDSISDSIQNVLIKPFALKGRGNAFNRNEATEKSIKH